MKNAIMLTENELNQVSGGGNSVETLTDSMIKAFGDKILIGSVAILISGVLMMFSKHFADAVEEFCFGKPEEKESGKKKKESIKASPAA